jgi:hypothetical protein
MNRVKDYADFVGWFAGLGYIVLWPVASPDLGGKPFGATVFCSDGAPSMVDSLCNWVHPLHLPPALHVLGFLSAIFVTTRLLVYAIRRPWRGNNAQTGTASLPGAQVPALQLQMLPRKPKLRRAPVKPRKEFGLRGVTRNENETVT